MFGVCGWVLLFGKTAVGRVKSIQLLFGKKYDRNLVRDKKEQAIHDLHAQGKPIAVIARIVGLSRKTIYKALSVKEASG